MFFVGGGNETVWNLDAANIPLSTSILTIRSKKVVQDVKYIAGKACFFR